VPFGKAAFFPGCLIHTNEYLVLLGEGYYAERTSKQTVEILQQRRKSLDSRVDSLEANIKDPQAEASFLNATTSFLVARFFWEKGLPSVENKEKILRNLLAKEKNLCTNATYRPVRELIQQERLKSLSWEFHVNQAYNQNTPDSGSPLDVGLLEHFSSHGGCAAGHFDLFLNL
ncbi:RNA polymerase II subunit 5-mediating protein-like isoform A, partial [Glycine soja]